MPRKPLTWNKSTGKLAELPVGTELDIPLEDRFVELQKNFRKLILVLVDEGFRLPDDLVAEMEKLEK